MEDNTQAYAELSKPAKVDPVQQNAEEGARTKDSRKRRSTIADFSAKAKQTINVQPRRQAIVRFNIIYSINLFLNLLYGFYKLSEFNRMIFLKYLFELFRSSQLTNDRFP